MVVHPLDRPIWTALTTRQAAFAEGCAGIRRFGSAFGPFAASAEGTPESLAELVTLVPTGGQVIVQHDEEIAPPPGLVLARTLRSLQMVAQRPDGASPDFAFAELTPADAPDMLALARLTRPGPFAERTHELGRFVGVRKQGHLVAMAGERMKPGPFTEISGVCTHPDCRGQGYARALLLEIARGIVARGETPFLHVIADNAAAIALYERLGFVTRWRPLLLVLQRAGD